MGLKQTSTPLILLVLRRNERRGDAPILEQQSFFLHRIYTLCPFSIDFRDSVAIL